MSRECPDEVAERFFSHVGRDVSTLGSRVRASGYLSGLSSWAIGENIAYGSGSYANAAKIVQMWMESPGHRANILSGRFRQRGALRRAGRLGRPVVAFRNVAPPKGQEEAAQRCAPVAAFLPSCPAQPPGQAVQKRRCARYLRRQRSHRRKR